MNEVARSFAEQLRRYRTGAGLSQDELAERAGLTAAAVSQLERGVRRRPQPRTLRALADALGLAGEARAALLTLARAAPPGPPPSLAPVGTDGVDGPGAAARRSLPTPLTSFIGRERELAAAALALAGGARLVTLTGAGGTGKTRLALAVAERIQASFPDGAVFVDLAPVREPALVAPAIGQALDVRESGGRSLLQALLESLRDKRQLLVLDNFEQVIEAAPLLRDLLQGCPDLTLLVTSRAVLRLAGEWEYAVPPLALPDRAQLATLNLPELAAVPAVALFVQRARQAGADFALTNENAAVVAQICRRLDGLPLAIELAAARVRSLSPQALLERLDRRLPLLTGGAHDLPARQQTLRDTLAWSYDLLSPQEQAVFRRLAVFAGGSTLAAAEAVCADAGDESLMVLDALTSLTEKSLLGQQEGAQDEPRLSMLETIREYGLEQLVASGEEAAVRRAHANYYAAFVEGAELHAPTRGAFTRQLEADDANLRAALSFGRDTPDGGERLLRFAAALGFYWFVLGRSSEGREWCEAALARPEAADSPALRARVFFSAGQLAWDQKDLPAARSLLEASAAGARAAGDSRCLLRALYALGDVLWALGDVDGAGTVTAELAACAGAAGDTWERGLALERLGMHAFGLGDLAAARACFEESLSQLRRMKDPFAAAYVARHLGYVAQAEGHFDEALRHMTESVATNRAIDDLRGVAAGLAALAGLAVAQEQAALATRLSAAAATTLERTGATSLHPRDRPIHDRTLVAERGALDGATFDALWAEGRALSVDAALELALASLEQTPGVGASAR